MLSGLVSILPKVVRPARYTGGEWNSVVKSWPGRLHVALAYPDVYEEAVCNPWLLSLYELLNREDGVLCERTYLPWPDMASALRQAGLPLFALESQRALADFDVVLMILPGERSTPVALTLLDLSGIPLHAADRHGPLVVGIGPTTANPEPLVPFFDAFIVGDVDAQTVRDVVDAARSGARPAAGIYVPRHAPSASEADALAAEPVVIRRFDALPPPPERPIVPFCEARHERAVVEMAHTHVFSWLDQPAIERPLEDILAAVESAFGATGYEHVLLTGWRHDADEIVGRLSARYSDRHVHIAFEAIPPTVQAVDLADRLPHLNRGPLTLELGAATHGQTLDAARLAFRRGWHILKLNLTVGLPSETTENVGSMVDAARRIRDIGREEVDGQAQVHVIATPYIPRAHGPWQRAALPSSEQWQARLELLARGVRGPGLRLFWRNLETRTVDAALARGDSRAGAAIEAAWHAGMQRPEDTENAPAWQAAFEAAGVDVAAYAARFSAPDATLPWQHIRSA